jgi:ElaB/YqjD/DUF883 family membrane-anchored ribosome-binding protein
MSSATDRPEFTAASPSSQTDLRASSQTDLRAKAEGAMSKIGDVAKEAAGEVKRSATTLAAEANDKAKVFMGQKVGAGADLIGHFAASTRVAADDLDRNAPQLAALVRDASKKMEQFSQEIHDQTIDQLVRRTSDFARERPAVMFGAAAACGFFLFRLFKAGTRTAGERTHDHREVGPPAFRPGVYHPDAPSISPRHGEAHGA